MDVSRRMVHVPLYAGVHCDVWAPCSWVLQRTFRRQEHGMSTTRPEMRANGGHYLTSSKRSLLVP